MTLLHLTAEDLDAALDGELSDSARLHLGGCRSCHARLASEAALEEAAHVWARSSGFSVLDVDEVSEIRRLSSRPSRSSMGGRDLLRESALAVACALILSIAGWRSTQSGAAPLKDAVASGCFRMQAWCR